MTTQREQACECGRGKQNDISHKRHDANSLSRRSKVHAGCAGHADRAVPPAARASYHTEQAQGHRGGQGAPREEVTCVRARRCIPQAWQTDLNPYRLKPKGTCTVLPKVLLLLGSPQVTRSHIFSLGKRESGLHTSVRDRVVTAMCTGTHEELVSVRGVESANPMHVCEAGRAKQGGGWCLAHRLRVLWQCTTARVYSVW